MLPAVEFDDKAPFLADEIYDVTSDGMLPSELEALEASVSEGFPNSALQIRLIPAQRPREFSRGFSLHLTSYE